MTRLMGRTWGCTGIMGIPRRERMAINEQYTVMADSFGEKNPPPVIYSVGAWRASRSSVRTHAPFAQSLRAAAVQVRGHGNFGQAVRAARDPTGPCGTPWHIAKT